MLLPSSASTSTKIHLRPTIFFEAQTFFGQTLFLPKKIFFTPKLFLDQKKNFTKNSFLDQLCSWTSFFRLEYDQDSMTRRTSYTYVSYRIIQLITGALWLAFGSFFRIRIHQTISTICPQGKHSAIGGKRKRNILSLGKKYDNKLMFSKYFLVTEIQYFLTFPI